MMIRRNSCWSVFLEFCILFGRWWLFWPISLNLFFFQNYFSMLETKKSIIFSSFKWLSNYSFMKYIKFTSIQVLEMIILFCNIFLQTVLLMFDLFLNSMILIKFIIWRIIWWFWFLKTVSNRRNYCNMLRHRFLTSLNNTSF